MNMMSVTIWRPALDGDMVAETLPFRLSAISEHWGDPMMPIGWLVVAVSVLVCAVAGMWLWMWWRRRHERPRPWWVYYRAARYMGLTLREQWLLIRIARHERLPSPMTLMMSRRTLGHHARRYVRGRPVRRRASVVRRVMAIRQALFDRGEGQGMTPAA